MTDIAGSTILQAAPAPQQRSRLLWPLLVLLAAWLSWPAWTPVHVESFSANLEAMAILLNAHGLAGLELVDHVFPLATEYQYMSRSGLVDILQGLMALTRQHGDGIFQAVMLLSMALYCWSCVTLARRWSGEPYAALIAALLLTPGLVEISFYYADNLPSAACALFALALIRRENNTALRWTLVGALFMAAILIRADATLVAPALGPCLLRERKRVPSMLLHAVCLGAGAVFILLLAQWLTPFRLMDSVQVVSLFKSFHLTLPPHRREVVVAAGFFGFITPMLLVFGLAKNARTRDWQWHLAWTLLPALFYLYAVPRALELRVFLLLGAPALLVHGATGLRVLREMWRAARAQPRWIARAVALAALVVMFGPAAVRMKDGPRSFLGRMYTPIIWHQWQQSVTRCMQQLDTFIASVQPGETVVAVSSHFNADHYLRLRLLQQGFSIMPLTTAPWECPGMNEVFRKGDRTIIHLRSEVAYHLTEEREHIPAGYIQAYQIAEEMKCLHTTPYGRAVLLNWQDLPAFFTPALNPAPELQPPWEISYPQKPVPSVWKAIYGEFNLQPETPAQMQALEQSARAEVANAERTAVGWKPLSGYADLHRMYRWRFGTPAIDALWKWDEPK